MKHLYPPPCVQLKIFSSYKVVYIAFLFFYAGCDNDLPTIRPQLHSAEENIRLAKTAGLDTKNIDEEFAYIAELVSSFAGYYYDKDRVIIQLKDPKQKNEIKAILKERFKLKKVSFSKQNDIENSAIQQAEYSFKELKNIKSQIVSKYSYSRIRFIDINEKINKVEVFVINQNKDIFLHEMNQLGVNPNALYFNEANQTENTLLTNLNDKVRPTLGGLKIERYAGLFSRKGCTLGINVLYTPSGSITAQRAFITNDHCTDVHGIVTGSVFHQHSYNAFNTNRVGTELINSPYFNCGPASTCVNSDAALVRYSLLNSEVEIGKIALTNNVSNGMSNGGHSIISSYNIVSNGSSYPNPFNGSTYGSSNPPVGIQVIKVGATTGATSGNITNSCYDFLIGNTTYLCQVKVSGYSGPGIAVRQLFKI